MVARAPIGYRVRVLVWAIFQILTALLQFLVFGRQDFTALKQEIVAARFRHRIRESVHT